MLACAIEVLSSAHSGSEPQWELGDFRYRNVQPDEDDPDFDPLAKGAQPAEQQIAILQQIAAGFR